MGERASPTDQPADPDRSQRSGSAGNTRHAQPATFLNRTSRHSHRLDGARANVVFPYIAFYPAASTLNDQSPPEEPPLLILMMERSVLS